MQLVAPIHACVPGRVRFKIQGLYRADPSVKARLETNLTRHAIIETVSASTLTGNLLVLFAPDQTLNEITALVEQAIETLGREPQRRDQDDDPNGSTQVAESNGATAVGAGSGWYRRTTRTALTSLRTSGTNGLTRRQAALRLARDGPNALAGSKPRSGWSLFREQFKGLPVALLAGAAAVSLCTGGVADAVAITIVVAINAGIGYLTERQSERTISSLTSHAPRTTSVLRHGRVQEIPVEHVVVGDILLLAPGTDVPADARLLHVSHLTVDESALTGESLPVAKTAVTLGAANTPIADRKNMVYMGTTVCGGSGKAVVVATGRYTELGAIQTLVDAVRPPKTPMQIQLDKMGIRLVLLSGAICTLVFFIGLLRGFGFVHMLKSAISLAVAAVPEGLPTIATVTLALGIQDMRRRKVLVRRLDAVETLGALQVLCLDKTGTLTRNKMCVVAAYAGADRFSLSAGQFMVSDQKVHPRQHADLWQLLRLITLCTESGLESGAPSNGSATEMALQEMALSAGVDTANLRGQYPVIEKQLRSERRPFMYTVHAPKEGKQLIALKGGPAEVCSLCQRQLKGGKVLKLSSRRCADIQRENERMAGDGLRVLGVAYAEADGGEYSLDGLIWTGLVGLADPLRPGMKELIEVLHRAGIRSVILTGDQRATAQVIGKELNLNNGGRIEVLDVNRSSHDDREKLVQLAQEAHVFARVSPSDKLRIVQALQHVGRVIAMTGDGINDAPALRAANVGVAMGENGTDAARSVADVVLLDDNLRTMVIAVRQGRSTYHNIRKSLRFLLTTNLSEIEVMLLALALGAGQPLNPMQLLWINLITDIFPGLALSLEPPEADVLELPPRDPKEPIIRRRELKRLGQESAVMTAGALGSYAYGLSRYGIGPKASTLTFLTLGIAQLLHALSCRSEHTTIFDSERPSNRYLDLALWGSLGAQVLAALVPGLRSLLGLAPLGLLDGLVVATCATLSLLINEGAKTGREKKRDAAIDTDYHLVAQAWNEKSRATRGSVPGYKTSRTWATERP